MGVTMSGHMRVNKDTGIHEPDNELICHIPPLAWHIPATLDLHWVATARPLHTTAGLPPPYFRVSQDLQAPGSLSSEVTQARQKAAASRSYEHFQTRPPDDDGEDY